MHKQVAGSMEDAGENPLPRLPNRSDPSMTYFSYWWYFPHPDEWQSSSSSFLTPPMPRRKGKESLHSRPMGEDCVSDRFLTPKAVTPFQDKKAGQKFGNGRSPMLAAPLRRQRLWRRRYSLQATGEIHRQPRGSSVLTLEPRKGPNARSEAPSWSPLHNLLPHLWPQPLWEKLVPHRCSPSAPQASLVLYDTCSVPHAQPGGARSACLCSSPC